MLILGYSFIRRLNSFTTDSTYLDHRFMIHEAALFKWHGAGGRTLEKTIRFDLHAPHIVILQLGTNDLSHLDPLIAASAIDQRTCRYSVRRAQCARNLCLPNANSRK